MPDFSQWKSFVVHIFLYHIVVENEIYICGCAKRLFHPIMFKFDFEVNNDENIDQTLNFETEPDEPAGVVQSTPELEPFTELSLDQLVRGSHHLEKCSP